MIKIVIEMDELTGQMKIEMPENKITTLGILKLAENFVVNLQPSKVLAPNGAKLSLAKLQ